MAEFDYNCSGDNHIHISVGFLGKIKTVTWKHGNNEPITYTRKNCKEDEKPLKEGDVKRFLKSVVKEHLEEAKDLAEVLQGEDAEQMRQAIFELNFETNLKFAELLKYCNS